MKFPELIDRDISWLAFNERVLQEAEDPQVPLMERLRFLGIFSSNLDEFFRVRIATIKRRAELKSAKIEARKAAKFLDEVKSIVLKQQKKLNEIYENQIRPELVEQGIQIINETELTALEQEEIGNYFDLKVAPRLFPLMISDLREFPNIDDGKIYLAVKLLGEQVHDPYAILNIPTQFLTRFYVLKYEESVKKIILIDDVIRANLHKIFKITGATGYEAHTIKLSRDAELDIEESGSSSMMDKIAKSIKQRKKGSPTRFIYDLHISPDFFKVLSNKLKIAKTQAIPGSRYHNFKDFIKFPSLGRTDLEYDTIKPIRISSLEKNEPILLHLLKCDELIAYPYQSFSYVAQLLREASINPLVTEINATLYRLAEFSAVANALINAARNGKKVRVLTELRARFMERENIEWSRRLRDEGVEILDTISNVKVHSKLLQIKLMHKGQERFIGHIGTGNFNENTATMYADMSLLTSDKEINREISMVFKLIRNFKPDKFKFNHLWVSPTNTRSRLIESIDNEIVEAKNKRPAHMILKCNSLEDTELCYKILEAAEKGVKVELLIRGIFRLPTALKHKNIKALSILDRYLEHSRIFYFNAAGKELIYIGSADIMTRNLDYRIEVTVPIKNLEHKTLLKKYLELQLDDNTKARYLHGDLSNTYRRNNKPLVRSQMDYYQILNDI